MKNSTDPSKYGDIGGFDAAGETLLSDLEALHDARVPELKFDTGSVLPAGSRTVNLRRWRLPVLAAATAVALALFLAGPSLWGGSSSEVSAQTIIQRTQNVATNASDQTNIPYHLVATRQDFPGPDDSAKAAALGKSATQSTIETWYLDAAHWRSDSHNDSTSPAFAGQARDGDSAWLYVQGDDGVVRVVHGSSALVADPPNSDGSEVAGVTNIAAVLSGLGSDNCHTAAISGDTKVAGRDAYQIEVKPTPDNCSFGANVSPEDQAAIRQKVAMAASGVTTLAVDKQTFVTLSVQVRDRSGNLVGQYDVTRFETGRDAAAGYAYQSPAGAQVSEVTSPSDAKMMLSGQPDISGKPAQEKIDKASPPQKRAP